MLTLKIWRLLPDACPSWRAKKYIFEHLTHTKLIYKHSLHKGCNLYCRSIFNGGQWTRTRKTTMAHIITKVIREVHVWRAGCSLWSPGFPSLSAWKFFMDAEDEINCELEVNICNNLSCIFSDFWLSKTWSRLDTKYSRERKPTPHMSGRAKFVC